MSSNSDKTLLSDKNLSNRDRNLTQRTAFPRRNLCSIAREEANGCEKKIRTSWDARFFITTQILYSIAPSILHARESLLPENYLLPEISLLTETACWLRQSLAQRKPFARQECHARSEPEKKERKYFLPENPFLSENKAS
ncbi:hypothetical protein PG999_014333 [Apiospora kogelbergensis]|uniref:Uncharacterized protein n=1 Tax=Apiospora kogelbergensis TaxID=1337665 RepID=A0AAW0QB53_9PEZI